MGKFIKKTHEEFLSDLWERNEYYRNGDFEVIEKYECNKCKILIRDKHGDLKVDCYVLLKGSGTNIQSAVDKSEYFRNMCLHRFGQDKFNDLSKINYIGTNTKITVVDVEFGEYQIKPVNYFRGSRHPQRALKNRIKKLMSDEVDVFRKILNIHDNIEIVEGQKYLGGKEHILVQDKYGVCSISPANLLSGVCPTISSAVDKNSYFANQAREVHGDKYDYSLVEYRGSFTKVKIVGEHGVFEQAPSNHLSGTGCPKEAHENKRKSLIGKQSTWKYSSWEKLAEESQNFDSYKVYIIRCWDVETGEEFYKIGRTFLQIKKRFYCQTALPYNYEIIEVSETGNARAACELEQRLQTENKDFRYVPQKKFGGMYECFSQIGKI